MPIANIIDCRDVPFNTSAYIVAEPSYHDNGTKGATQHEVVDPPFLCRELGTMPLVEAINLLHGEQLEVTLYLYNPRL